VIILVLSNLRMILDNLAKYGILLRIPGLDLIRFGLGNFMTYIINPGHNNVFLEGLVSNMEELIVPLQCVCSWGVSICLSFAVEVFAANNWISESVCLILYFVMATVNIAVPCLWTYYGSGSAALSMMYLLQSVVLWMKLISYNHVNSDLRKLAKWSSRFSSSGALSPTSSSSSLHNMDGDSGGMSAFYLNSLQEVKDQQPPFLVYPHNLTMSNLLWFCIAPTLCYQLNYPRSPSIRTQYVLSILLRMLIVGVFIVFCVEQYIAPTLTQSLAALKSRNIAYVFMRLIKLSIPNTYVWLLGFYFYFHLWLNLLAELTRFGDRCFYKDW
jgi:diacylglycerol O-acyltransferase-1